MSDLALVWDGANFAADLAIDANDLLTDDGLETAVMLSLFLDRRAEDADTLPDAVTDRRGWWGDEFPIADGDKIGSRLWLLSREKQTAAALTRAQEYAQEALAWLVEDKVAERVDVTADFPRPGVLGLSVIIYRPHVDPAKYRFNHIWAAQGA